MNYRKFGNTGLNVSEIGFGTWGIGGNSNGAIAYGPTEDEISLQALHKAFDQGVTFYDTADLYGFGHSEELLGKAFRKIRDKVIIASKVGCLDFESGQDFSVSHMRNALEGSLRRLQTDYIDLYQLHSPSMDLLANDGQIFSTMEKFKDDA